MTILVGWSNGRVLRDPGEPRRIGSYRVEFTPALGNERVHLEGRPEPLGRGDGAVDQSHESDGFVDFDWTEPVVTTKECNP